MEKKPWEEGDEEVEEEEEEEGNFIVELVMNSVRQMACVQAIKRKMGGKSKSDDDVDEEIPLKDVDEELENNRGTRRSSASSMGRRGSKTESVTAMSTTPPKASPAISKGSGAKSRIKRVEEV